MRHFLHRLLFVALFVNLTLPAYAQGPDRTKPGFSGRVQGGGFFLQTDSQLSTADSDSRAGDLEGPADTFEEILPLVSVFLRYRFDSGTSVYFGNPLEVGEGLAVAAGVTQPLSAGTVDVALTWLPIKEVWENPYLTAAARQETDVDSYGLRLKWQEINGSPWEAAYNIRRIDVENDVIGNIENDLKRSGWTHDLSVKYTLPLKPGVNLKPELSYTYADIEGLSNSYHGFKAGVQLQRIKPPWVLIGHVSGFYNQYDRTHPIFDKTREESGITTFAQAMRLNLFGVERLFGSIAAGYIWSDANIDFFDSQTIIGLASIGMEF